MFHINLIFSWKKKYLLGATNTLCQEGEDIYVVMTDESERGE